MLKMTELAKCVHAKTRWTRDLLFQRVKGQQAQRSSVDN